MRIDRFLRGLRCASALTALVVFPSFAETQPPKPVETALRGRVKQFYSLMVEKKYRAAERLVAPAARDSYYEQEKPVLKNFQIVGVTWDKGFQKADVSLTGTVRMRRAAVGDYDVKVPFASHWVHEQGQWLWYIPKVFKRSTPFGPMNVDPNAAKESGLNIQSMISKGPKEAELVKGVVASTNRLMIKGGVGNTGTATLENSLPGVVRIFTQVVTTAGVSAKLSKQNLGLGDKATLTVTRKGPPVKGSTVYVRVEPTGQQIPITIEETK